MSLDPPDTDSTPPPKDVSFATAPAADKQPLVQAQLFAPSQDPADLSSLPPDIREALAVLTGGLEFKDGEIVPSAKDPLDLANGGPEGKNAQQRFVEGLVKKEEMDKAKREYHNYEIHVLDLAQAEDAATYIGIMNRFGAAGSTWVVEESDKVTVIDPNSPRGFRSIITVKMFQVRKSLPGITDKPATPPAPPAA